MRTISSIKNLIVAFIGQFLGIVINFVARIIFLKILTSEYLGLNSLFTNILTILSLAELGIGTAMNFSLYKPLAEKNIEKIKTLMQLYKKAYIIIAVFILILGTIITPTLPFFIEEMPNIPENIYLIYFLFLINTSISYFFSYKRALIITDQKRYVATMYRYVFYFLLNTSQIIGLIITKNYIVFLIIQILFTLLENICISLKANKMYPYLKEKNIQKMQVEEKNVIKKNVGATFLHNIGGVVSSTTDNILISKFLGLNAVGLYSNYYLIINALNIVIGQVFTSIIASVGNLAALANTQKLYDTFKKVLFLDFWIFGFCSICLYVLSNDFIQLWLGEKYLLSISIVFTLTIIFYLTGMRKAVLIFKEALGLFWHDRYKPILGIIVSLVVSIPLINIIGMIGVFIGTIVSTLTTCFWIEPFVLYKYGFKMKLSNYFKLYIKYTLITVMVAIITVISINLLFITTSIINFIGKLLLCIAIPNLCFILIFRKNEEFKYFESLIKSILDKILNRNGEKKKC